MMNIYFCGALFDYKHDVYHRQLRAYSFPFEGSTITAFTDGTSSTLNRRWPDGRTLTVEPE